MATDRPRHRGPHPQDVRLFALSRHAVLRRSVQELGWLLTRGYPEQAALKLVGDRHKLTARQRKAVTRCACSQQARDGRGRKRLSPEAIRGRSIAVDGFNCLFILESAYSGAVVLRGRDGALRDMASVHGSYRRVEETLRAIGAIGQRLAQLQAAGVTWYLDKPVSNSGRLAGMLERYAGEREWPWEVVLCNNPDASIIASGAVAASSDSWILDRCDFWIDIPGLILDTKGELSRAWIVDLGGEGLPDPDTPQGAVD